MSALLAKNSGAHVGACYGKVSGVAVIVVGGEICQDVLPATVVVDWAGRIDGSTIMLAQQMWIMEMDILGLVIQRTKMVALLDIVLQRSISPTLIRRSPSNNGRMVDVSLDRRYPLAVDPLDKVIAKCIGIGHLTPDKEAQSIGPVVKDRILNLLVLAATTEPHFLRQLNVDLQGFWRRRCETSLVPVALVQDHGLEERFVVDSERSVAILP